MDKADASALTERIRTAVNGLGGMLLEAHNRKAWKALGYKTWEAYVKAEVGMGRSRSYQLLNQGRVIEAVRRSTGDLSTKVDISEREARDIRSDLPAVTDEIKARVEAGEDPTKAAADTIAAKRAAKEKAKGEKDAQQAEYDRQRDESRDKLAEAVKREQAAKDAAIEARKGNRDEEWLSAADRIAELEEAMRTVESENAALKAENKLYGEMRIQWAAGGYEAVIAGKDEEIRALESRLYSESADKASWAGNAKYWKEQAKKLGWSNELVIDVDTGEVVNG